MKQCQNICGKPYAHLMGGNHELGDRSYGSGARYLLELIEAHKAEYQQRTSVSLESEQDLSKA